VRHAQGIADDWTVTASKDGLTLEDPEKQLKVDLVEVEARVAYLRTFIDRMREPAPSVGPSRCGCVILLNGAPKYSVRTPVLRSLSTLAGSLQRGTSATFQHQPQPDGVLDQKGRATMLRTARDLKGTSIAATDGDIGSVQDLYFDGRSWTVRDLIVDTGT
jgi:hypothetical protein